MKAGPAIQVKVTKSEMQVTYNSTHLDSQILQFPLSVVSFTPCAHVTSLIPFLYDPHHLVNHLLHCNDIILHI